MPIMSSLLFVLVHLRKSVRHSRFLSSQAGSSAVLESSIAESKFSGCTSENKSLNVNISYPALMIWGANTNVGKTIISAGLSASILSGQKQRFADSLDSAKPVTETVKDVFYIKPLQTGYPKDSDARFVARQVFDILLRRQSDSENQVCISNQTAQVSSAVQRALNSEVALLAEDEIPWKRLGSCEEQSLNVSHQPELASDIYAKQNAYPSTFSPRNNPAARDSLPSHLKCTTLWAWCDPVSPHLAAHKERAPVADSSVQHSLAASLGSFANSKFDGAGAEKALDRTYESDKWVIIETAGGVASPGPSGNLQCDIYRPFRLPGVLVGDGQLGGITTTISSFESLQMRGYDIDAIILSDFGFDNDSALLRHLHGRVPVFVLPPIPAGCLGEWYTQSKEVFAQLQVTLKESHLRRLHRLRTMPMKAEQDLWWPFTQHTMVPTRDITVIDSRCGESFSVHKSSMGGDGDVLLQQFDGCASWWTQGPDAKLQGEIARDIGYAAARYGHVMFPENVHEPALNCAELLLQSVGKGWAKRVYYSDNGSTAVEIALKMAFRKFVFDHSLLDEFDGALASSGNMHVQLKVLALRGSYHGDTLGAMEAQAPSSYTGFLQQPWYSGRGLFVDPPSVYLCRGRWQLDLPRCFKDAEYSNDFHFKSKEHAFDLERDHTAIAKTYQLHISQLISSFQANGDTAVGALIIEPAIHAAGGMKMIDPLFQRVLVRECQRQRIPVIFDEVFSGCWRLGFQSAAELLKCSPDIACYSKLLTGGTVPLAATLAREDVFEVFQGKSKLDALLHGHSYTAHAVGCAAALTSQAYFSDPLRNSNLLPDGRLQELWDPAFVDELSSHPTIQRVVTLGTLFSCELETGPEDSGYASTSARGLIQRLRKDGIYVRPLGSVIYLLCGPLTPPQTCSALLETLHRHL